MTDIVQFYVEDTGKDYEDAQLIELAAASWAKHGWTVEQRTHEQAKAHPYFEKLHANMHALTFGYGQGARAEVMYNRWLGHCPGWVSDYDIINLGFSPEDAEKLLKGHEDPTKLFLVSKCFRAFGSTMYPPTPAFLTEQSLDRLLRKFVDYRPWMAQGAKFRYIDDQNLIGSLWREQIVEHRGICAMFRQKHWQHAPLVHFSAWSINKSRWGRGRVEAVQKALQTLEKRR